MNLLESYAPAVYRQFSRVAPELMPWQITDDLPDWLEKIAKSLEGDYVRNGGVIVHRTANIHPTAILQDVIIVGPNASIGPHAILRRGVIGPQSAVAQSQLHR